MQFEHAPANVTDVVALELRKVAEDAGFFARLRELLASVSEGQLPPLNFVVGDARMYSKQEQKRLLKLPLVLFDRLERDTATELVERMKHAGIDARIREPKPARRSVRRPLFVAGIASSAILAGLAILGAPVWALALPLVLLAVFALVTVVVMRKRPEQLRTPLLQLRSAPAALPASDPWVARLATVLRDGAAPDVREQVGELALLLQRLIDHRSTHAREGGEIDFVTQAVPQLVELIEVEVPPHAWLGRLAAIDAELADLDEGTLVRALAVGSARAEPPAAREAALARLDRLRTLEDARARAFHRLLEAGRLLRRSVELGLAVRDPEVAQAAEVRLALHALSTAQ